MAKKLLGENKFAQMLHKALYNDPKMTRLLAFLLLVLIFMSIAVPDTFLTQGTLLSISYQLPELALYALAITLAMLLGGIDLSVVSLGNMATMFAILLTKAIEPAVGPTVATIASILLALVIGAAAGAVNGLFIAKLGIPAMLATLGTSELFFGICYIFTEGTAIFGLTDAFLQIGTGTVAGVPIPAIIFLVILLFFALLFTKTKLGRQIYLVGTNEQAARFSGIDKDGVIIKTHIISAILAVIAGMILCARASSVKADYGQAYTMQCILIAVLGGINPSGGFGKISGILLASITLQMLATGLNMLRVVAHEKEMVWGALLIIFMVINFYSEKAREQRRILAVQKVAQEKAASEAANATEEA